MEHVIDAQGKSLGRIASGAAAILRGKSEATFERNKTPISTTVKIVNAKGVKLSGEKELTKRYDRYSGHPGGLKSLSVAHVSEKKGRAEIIKKAVHGMLPKNKLRPILMKNLSITE